MKRFIVFAVLLSLLLCGCTQLLTPPTEPATQPTTEPAAESTPTTEPTTEPTQPVAERVTVYLLKKTAYFDSGYVEYTYDEDHNIDAYKVFTIENAPMYDVYFEGKDANGMAGLVRTQWADGMGGDTRKLVYSADGKLQEEQMTGSTFSGFQFAYDQQGNRTEKREYYEGVLESAVYYEYDGRQLTEVFCQDKEGNKIFQCKVENGRIVEQNCYDSESEYGYRYEYDENGNLIKTTYYQDGVTFPGDQYFYEAVEVDAARAPYLLEQQKYLIPMA